MKTAVHAAAATSAMLIIATFWVSTSISELFFDPLAVAAVKHAIAVYGLPLLIPALALTGASGFSLAKVRRGRLVERKKRRMPFIVLNGLLVLLPSALFLYYKSDAGEFDTLFYVIQSVELTAGLIQLVLMGLNFRDGARLTGRNGLVAAPRKPTGQHTVS